MKRVMSFDKYMEICLYDKKIGYYIKNKKIFGKEGDFFTPQTVSKFFGEVIANFLKKHEFKNVYEFGGGDGSLAFDILSSNSEIEKYYIFEISENNRKTIKEKLKSFEEKVIILKSIDEIKEMEGFFIMVEFIDSFPCKRFLKNKGFFEVWVDIKEKKEIFKKANFKFLKYYEFLPDGYFFEFPYSFMKWFKKFLKKFIRGKILFIDYGVFKNDLINYPEGTIRGFKKHKLIKNILNYEIGEIDITYTPDFSFLKELFVKNGFEIERISSLSKFLIEEGILEISEKEILNKDDLYFKIKKLGEIKTLILPEIMGESYLIFLIKK
ncbi:MAG: SAM-dependent methyltransferase [candidate division WOR-3 bacterium]